MTSNTLTPVLDKSINVMEMAPENLVELHTKIHAVYDGLRNGRYFDNWTFEDCKRIHNDLKKRMKDENIKHVMTESELDALAVQDRIALLLKRDKISSKERSDLIDTIDKQQKQIEKILRGKNTLEEDMNRVKSFLNKDEGIRNAEKNDIFNAILIQQKQISQMLKSKSDIEIDMNRLKTILKKDSVGQKNERDNLIQQISLIQQQINEVKRKNELFFEVRNSIENERKLKEEEEKKRNEFLYEQQLKTKNETNVKLNELKLVIEKKNKEIDEERSKITNLFSNFLDIKKQEKQEKLDNEKQEKLDNEKKEKGVSLQEIREYFKNWNVTDSRLCSVYLIGDICDEGITYEKMDVLVKSENKNEELENLIKMIFPTKLQSRLNFIYSKDVDISNKNYVPLSSYIPLFEYVLKKEPIVEKYSSSEVKKNITTGTIPPELSRVVAKLPKEVKSNMKDLLKFAKDKGCPNCNSKMIRLIGYMENGLKAKFGCVDCQLLWTLQKKSETEDLATYKYEKLGKDVWDKVYPNLLKFENSLYKKLKKLFDNIRNNYVEKYKSGKKELADKVIGMDELALTLEAEMIDIAYDGEVTVANDLKRAVPKALNPQAAKFIETYSIKLAGDISKEIKEQIRQQIELGIKEGAGVREIKNRIASVFDKGLEVKVSAKIVNGKIIRKEYTRLLSAETRARAIARTETIRAFNKGRYEAMQKVDVVTGWKFEASADERTCEICQGLDGQEFKKNDDSNLPPNPHVSCRCTFSYLFAKKMSEEVTKKNTKPKFKLQKNSESEKHKIEIPNLDGSSSQILKLETVEKDIEKDIGWIEHGTQKKNFQEFFLHGKRIKGRWLSDGKILRKAKDEIPYVLSGKGYIPPKGFSALPKGLMARIPVSLRWYEQDLEGVEATKIIETVRKMMFEKEEPKVNIRKMTTEEEIQMMLKNIEPMKIENQIKQFLGEYKIHRHTCSLDAIKLEKLEGWPQKKTPFKLPLPVEGTALSSGAFRGMSGEWIFYPESVIAESAPLLTGCQIRLDHSEDGSPLSTVVGWVTKSWKGKDSKGKAVIKYKGLIFDHDRAKDVYNRKIRKTSVSPFVKEVVDEQRGLIAEKIAKFEEISILSSNNPACPSATVNAI